MEGLLFAAVALFAIWLIAVIINTGGAIATWLMFTSTREVLLPLDWDGRRRMRRGMWEVVIAGIGAVFVGGVINIAAALLMEQSTVQWGVLLFLVALGITEALLIIVVIKSQKEYDANYLTLLRDAGDAIRTRTPRHPSKQGWRRLLEEADEHRFRLPVGAFGRSLSDRIGGLLPRLDDLSPPDRLRAIRRTVGPWSGLTWMMSLHHRSVPDFIFAAVFVVGAASSAVGLALADDPPRISWLVVGGMASLSAFTLAWSTRSQLMIWIKILSEERIQRERCNRAIARISRLTPMPNVRSSATALVQARRTASP